MSRRAVLRVPMKTFLDIDTFSSLKASQAHFRELEFLGVEQEMFRFLKFCYQDIVRDSFVYGFQSFNHETHLPLCAHETIPMELTVQQLNSCLLHLFEKDSPCKVRTVAMPVIKEKPYQKKPYRRLSQE